MSRSKDPTQRSWRLSAALLLLTSLGAGLLFLALLMIEGAGVDRLVFAEKADRVWLLPMALASVFVFLGAVFLRVLRWDRWMLCSPSRSPREDRLRKVSFAISSAFFFLFYGAHIAWGLRAARSRVLAADLIRLYDSPLRAFLMVVGVFSFFLAFEELIRSSLSLFLQDRIARVFGVLIAGSLSLFALQTLSRFAVGVGALW